MPGYISPYITRKEPVHQGQPTFTESRLNVRPVISYPQGPHEAPDPLRQSDYNYEGKPLGHAQSRQQIAVSQNISSINAIMEQHFLVQSWARSTWTATPPLAGGEHPWVERSNISVPPAIAYGSLFTIGPLG